MNKKKIYIDMDGVLCDFIGAFNLQTAEIRKKYNDNKDDVPGMFRNMVPLKDAIQSFHKLSEEFDVFILSSAPWNNPSAWSDKLLWVKEHLGNVASKRLILSHRKDLNKGDFLIDDRPNNGAENFEGEWLHFGPKGTFKNWNAIIAYFEKLKK